MAGDIKEDSRLVRRALRDDQEAFRELLERYRGPVYGIVRRMVPDTELALDISQEAFIRAFKNLDKFDQKRSFANWIFRIATNLCIDHHRKRKINTVSMVHSDDGGDEHTWDAPDTAHTPGEEYTSNERRRQMVKLVDSLPGTYKSVIVLRYQEDRSYDEIAEILELPLGTIKARIHRAHKILKDKLTQQGFDFNEFDPV